MAVQLLTLYEKADVIRHGEISRYFFGTDKKQAGKIFGIASSEYRPTIIPPTDRTKRALEAIKHVLQRSGKNGNAKGL